MANTSPKRIDVAIETNRKSPPNQSGSGPPAVVAVVSRMGRRHRCAASRTARAGASPSSLASIRIVCDESDARDWSGGRFSAYREPGHQNGYHHRCDHDSCSPFSTGVLTAARGTEVRRAVWSEMDQDSGGRTIPASRMRATREHRVPLCGLAGWRLRSGPEAGQRREPGRVRQRG